MAKVYSASMLLGGEHRPAVDGSLLLCPKWILNYPVCRVLFFSFSFWICLIVPVAVVLVVCHSLMKDVQTGFLPA
jgi:hypothetical protein